MRRLGVWLALLAAPASLTAQQDSLMAVAVRLATEGQGDSARALIRQQLRRLSPTDTLYPQYLYAAGVVADQADSAAHYFRRVSIEYSRSPSADSSLLRLAQLAYASGDFSGTLQTTQRLLMDYPFSPLLAEASYWAGRSQLELDSLPPGCELLAQAATLAGDNVELVNRVRFYRQRCSLLTAAQDSTPAATAPRAGATVYAVQVAAVRSPTAADELMRSLAAQGHEPHVVRDADGLFKVRVGRFTRREEAQRLAVRLKRALGGNPFVVEET